MEGDAAVRVWRAEEVESVHRVHAALARADGTLAAWCGDPETRAFLRSAAKPVQLLPLVEEGLVERYGFTGEELAIMASSHNAEPHHVDAVERVLAKAGLDPGLLQCGVHPPLHAPAAEALLRSGRAPTPLHNNCSGKHAGMLATSRALGWPLESYRHPDHPLQRRILERVADLSGVPEAGVGRGFDGCGVPTFALPVAGMARLFARLADQDAARDDDPSRAVGVVLDAMAAHPAFVAGTDRLCTELLAVAGDRVVVKTGVEGIYGAVLRDRAQGLALKVADGARRAQDMALMALLAQLDVVVPGEVPALDRWFRPVVTNRAGTIVGRIDAALALRRPA